MLSLGPGSSCDICFESFNSTSKAPSSIACGHVFCSMCIVQITRLCPMCRIPFDSYSIVKLHIDVESNPESVHCSAESIQKAKDFQAKIFKIADDGISEKGLQELINEGRAFLATQDRALHKDLRTLFRLIKYLNSIKISSRDQMQAAEMLTAKVEGLEKEKEEIRSLMNDTEATRQLERDTALAVEASLRGHIKRIQEHSDKATSAYLALVQLYNKISLHNKDLVNKLTNAGLKPGPIAEIYQTEILLTSDPSSVDNVASIIDGKSLQGVAVQNSKSSYLISPLPQFTTALPNTDKFMPLPDLEDDEEEEDEESTEDEEEGLYTPDGDVSQTQFREYPSRSATMPSTLPPPIKTNYEASGISRSAPYTEHRRRERSRSNPIDKVPLHRRNPQDDTLAPSTPPTPPYPSEADASRDPYAQSSASQQSRQSTSQSYSHYSSKHSISTSEYPPMPMNEDRLSSSNTYIDPLVRLQNILSSDPPMSSSLPNSGSRNFPSSYSARDTRNSPPPRSGSSTSHTQTPTPQTSQQQPQSQSQNSQQEQSHSHQYGPHHQHQVHQGQKQQPQGYQQQQQQQQQQTHPSSNEDKSQTTSFSVPTSTLSKPMVSQATATAMANMNTKAVSTASAHAQKLEEEKRRKHEEEKRRRQEERYQAEERERYQQQQQQQQQQQEHDGRFNTTKYVSASAAAAAAATARQAQAQAQQQQAYGPNVQMQMSSSPGGLTTIPSAKRGPSISNASSMPYGRM